METYSIIDLKGYAQTIREGAAKSFTENYEENLDEFISIDQIIGLINEHNVGRDDEDNYLITEDNFNEIFEEVRNRLYTVGLSRLAAKGLVECAWDDESNEMVFWLSDAGETHIKNRPSNNHDRGHKKK